MRSRSLPCETKRNEMSLDISLVGPEKEVPCICCGCGNEHTKEEREKFYDGNITHNLGAMAEAAGIYKLLWRPEELGITKAGQIIDPLRSGVELLNSDPERFKKFNPSNGWGSYESLLAFAATYLAKCSIHPEAEISVCR